MPPKRQRSPSPGSRLKSPSSPKKKNSSSPKKRSPDGEKKRRPPMSLKPFIIQKSPPKPVYKIPSSPTQFPSFYYASPSPRNSGGASAVFSIPSSTGGGGYSPLPSRTTTVRRTPSPRSPTF